MSLRLNVDYIKAHKNKKEPLVCLTAYTMPMAHILDDHCDLLLVGDSLGMVVYGMENTLGVTLDMIINHTKAVMRGSQKSFIVADMPYGTYENSKSKALENAQTLIEETGCQAVKLEGGKDMAETIYYLTSHNIEVMGHIGLLPQSVEKEGGYKIKGRNTDQEHQLLKDAKAVEEAGAFSFVIESTIEPVSQMITKTVNIPTIGIGAAASCDGQILVTEDLMGILPSKPPKFAKQYGDIKTDISNMVQNYAKEVRSREFPSSEYLYSALKKAS